MELLIILLRVAHILGGVLWVGASIFLFRFIEPTARELGPQAGPFMRGLTETRNMVAYIATAAGLTVVAGTILFLIDAGGDPVGWMAADATGLAFGIGGLAAWAAFVIGFAGLRPAIAEIGAAGAAMQAAGGPPTAEMMGRMHAAQERAHRLSLINAVLLVVAVVTMAIARYL